MKKNLAILGSTGSIGRQTLEVVEASNGYFNIIGLASKGDDALFERQKSKYKPKVFSSDGSKLSEIATHPDVDMVVVAVPGAACLQATLDAIAVGKDIALASKEVLVAAGELVNAKIYPIDSEHSAIMQCLKNEDKKKVKKIILTASGGPFLNKDLGGVTVAEALAHPKWKMGPKITIDSATLMNKGLEVIEAHFLFDMDYSKIEVIIHPQSIIHSMVEFVDGSVIAQLGVPDMRLPIQYALYQGDRISSEWPKLDISKVGQLSFQKVDTDKFPCLELAYVAGKTGGTMPAVLNAANEVAVDMFLKGKIRLTDIPKLVEKTMNKHKAIKNPSLKDILEADSWARAF